MIIMIDATREGYGIDQVPETMTVGELSDFLTMFDEDDKIYMSHDNGYTYGGIRRELFHEYDEEDSESY